MQKRILSLLVDNTAGVLSRIAGLFSRRGYNIDSLTVGVTADETIFQNDSRMQWRLNDSGTDYKTACKAGRCKRY